MFKKLSVIFLSICIVTAMVLGANSHFAHNNEHDNAILCILEVERESY